MTHDTAQEQERLSFDRMFDLAEGPTARVELCRIASGGPVGEMVAVKRLRPELADDPDFIDMFRDEMWMAAALRHPHVAQVVAWGDDDQGLFLAVEFVRGVSLARLMRNVFSTGEAFTPRLVVYLAMCVCDGLVAAHELRSPAGDPLDLVHRDLTPGNILLGFDGAVKITDFGLAKAKQRITTTALNVTKGEPAYMSPEQVTGAPLDGRSDLFSLGLVLFELLGKQRPWTVRNVMEALKYTVGSRHPDLAALCPRVDQTLLALINRCLEKAPDQRWPSARDLKTELERWLHLHAYRDTEQWLARFVRRNALRQMRWLDRAIAAAAPPVSRPLSLRTQDKASVTGSYPSQPSAPAVSYQEPPPPPAPVVEEAVSAIAAISVGAPKSRTNTEATRSIRRPPPRASGAAAGQDSVAASSSMSRTLNHSREANHAGANHAGANHAGANHAGASHAGANHADVSPDDAIDDAPTCTAVPSASDDDEAYATATTLVEDGEADTSDSIVAVLDARRAAAAADAATRRGCIVDDVQATAMRMAVEAQDLSMRSHAAAEQARRAAAYAEQAAHTAEQWAKRLAMAARAVEYAADAMRLVQAGDVDAAATQIELAHRLQQQAAVTPSKPPS